MTARARCGLCSWEFDAATSDQAARVGWLHYDRNHAAQPPAATITQLPNVTFREQALAAIKALAVTGRDFTVGEAHQMVSVQPANPRTDWETARKEAERLGWIQWAGTYADSIVPSTKGSAVKVWRGTYAVTRGVA